MNDTVLVVCRVCDGSRNAPDSLLVCDWCLGQGHECIDRAPGGGVPEGFREWIPHTLPTVPLIPLDDIPRCVP